MIRFLSSKLADLLIKNEIVSAEDREIYIYGYEIIVSSLFGAFSVLLLGIILRSVIESLVFLIIFIVIRQCCGGYHANSYIKCIASFVLVFVLVIIGQRLVLPYYSICVLVIISVVCMSVILDLAPIENAQKPLTVEIKRRNRKSAIIMSLIVISVSVLLYAVMPQISLTMMLTLLSICMLMIYENLRGGAKHEDN